MSSYLRLSVVSGTTTAVVLSGTCANEAAQRNIATNPVIKRLVIFLLCTNLHEDRAERIKKPKNNKKKSAWLEELFFRKKSRFPGKGNVFAKLKFPESPYCIVR
jgi:hypothetical protein